MTSTTKTRTYHAVAPESPETAAWRRIGAARLALPFLLAAGSVCCGDDADPGSEPGVHEVSSDVADSTDVPPPEDTPAPEDVLPDLPPGVPEGDAGEPGPDVSPYVEECRAWLAKGQPFFALESAEAGLALAPDDPDALFCAALSGMIDRTELALSLLTLFDMASTYAGFVPEPTWGEELAEELQGIFVHLHAGFATAVERLDAIDDPGFVFDVESAWVYSGARPALVYRGRFDHGDVLLMRLCGRFVLGFLDIFKGQDMRSDIATLISFVAGNLFDSFKLDVIMKVVSYLLATDEHFLSLHPEDGAPAFQEAREVLLELGPSFREALETIAAIDPDPETPDVSSCSVEAGQYVLRVRSRVEVDEESGMQVEKEVVLPLGPGIVSGLDAVSDSVATPGVLVRFDEGIAQMLALMLVTVVDTGLFGEISLGPLTLTPGGFEAELLATLIGGIIPVHAAFDLGTFYSTPVGLRALLPVVVDGGGLGKDSFLMEWECPSALLGGQHPDLLCPAGAELVDSAHFVGTDHEIPADGYLTAFPYMVFTDPTLGGLLYADLTDVVPGWEGGPKPADLGTINIIAAEALVPIFGLLQKE